jgi:hypothetical protein
MPKNEAGLCKTWFNGTVVEIIKQPWKDKVITSFVTEIASNREDYAPSHLVFKLSKALSVSYENEIKVGDRLWALAFPHSKKHNGRWYTETSVIQIVFDEREDGTIAMDSALAQKLIEADEEESDLPF